MSVLLDTSVVIDILRSFPAAMEFARALYEQPTCSEVTRVEVLRGVRSDERMITQRLLGTFQWIGVDATIAKRAGEIGRSYRRSHPGIGIADLLIAATAQELGLALVTGNVKHFPMFEGLQAPYLS